MTCAFAVREAFRKLPGVENVDVSLNKGVATVKMKAGNTLSIEQFWQLVRRNGFTSKETIAVIRGVVIQNGAKLRMEVQAAGRTFDLVSDPKAPNAYDEVKRQAGKPVIIEGILFPGKDLTSAVPIQVRALRP